MSDAPPAEGAAAAAAPPPKSKKMLIIIVAAVVALAAAGGGAYMFLGHKADDESAESDDSGDEAAADEEAKPAKKSKKGDKKGKKGKKDEPKAPAIYVKLDPPFVVNFEAQGVMRFLQVTVEVLTRDPHVAEMVKANDPRIRNDLLMLFGSMSSTDLKTNEGKEKLRTDALAVVAKIVAEESDAETGKKVEQLFFTSFVMQ